MTFRFPSKKLDENANADSAEGRKKNHVIATKGGQRAQKVGEEEGMEEVKQFLEGNRSQA